MYYNHEDVSVLLSDEKEGTQALLIFFWGGEGIYNTCKNFL